MEMPADKIIELDSLEIGFISGKTKRLLLPPFSAKARRGELIAVIGRNGIGKSTLLRTITGLQPSLNGSLLIESRDIRDYSRKELAEKAGYISTEIIRVSNLSVYDLAAQGRFPHTNWYGRIDPVNHEAIVEALSKAGMTDFSERMVTELSDGERQRAMIAMVLAQDAIIMVMDEPTAFLDIRSRFEIMHLLHQLTREKGKTIIFSTHDFDTAVSEADKIWLMLNDRFSEGAPEDLILSGAINSLFDEAVVRFNSHNGTFMTGREIKGAIAVTGEGDLKFWTERAVVRSGYSVAKSGSSTSIFTPDKNNSSWRVKATGCSLSFNSLYSLSSWLRAQTGLIS
jgi:iron complex transport system ATP-binding protein